jgi:DNA-binding MarR family transcriptional regulator
MILYRTKSVRSQKRGRIAELIGRLMLNIGRRAPGETLRMIHENGLTVPQIAALHVLFHKGVQSVSAIAACLNLSLAATSHMIDRLVHGGLVARTEDPADRRQKRIAISGRGRRLLEKLDTERGKEIEHGLSGLNPELRNSFEKLLEQVVMVLAALPPVSDTLSGMSACTCKTKTRPVRRR